MNVDAAGITAEFLRTRYDWSRTQPDMVDRVIRAIEMQAETIVACCGVLRPNTVITWCDYGYIAPLDAGNISFRCGIDDVPDGESVLAVPNA